MQAEKFAHSNFPEDASNAIVCYMKFRIKEHRNARGWTQDHLAALSGTSKGFISQLESGKRDPSAETLRSLAAAFDIDVTEMIDADSDEARRAIDHLSVFQRLSPEDQAAIARIAAKMLPDTDEK